MYFVKNTCQAILEEHSVESIPEFYMLLPVQHSPVKVQMLAFQLQLWPHAPAGDVDDDRLWIVFDLANYTVLHLSNVCWVGPHCQFLARKK